MSSYGLHEATPLHKIESRKPILVHSGISDFHSISVEAANASKNQEQERHNHSTATIRTEERQDQLMTQLDQEKNDDVRYLYREMIIPSKRVIIDTYVDMEVISHIRPLWYIIQYTH